MLDFLQMSSPDWVHTLAKPVLGYASFFAGAECIVRAGIGYVDGYKELKEYGNEHLLHVRKLDFFWGKFALKKIDFFYYFWERFALKKIVFFYFCERFA